MPNKERSRSSRRESSSEKSRDDSRHSGKSRSRSNSGRKSSKDRRRDSKDTSRGKDDKSRKDRHKDNPSEDKPEKTSSRRRSKHKDDSRKALPEEQHTLSTVNNAATESIPASLQQPATSNQSAVHHENCENCSRVSKTAHAEAFCLPCDLLLCGSCNRAIHGVPAFSSHIRGQPQDAASFRRRCDFHPSNTLRFFCDSCHQLTCSDCRLYGSHQGQSHLVLPVMEAYRMKLSVLQNKLDTGILRKKDAVIHQMQHVESRMEEVRLVQGAIERETREDAQSIVDRLSAAANHKLAVLQRDLDVLRSEVDSVDRLTAKLSSGTQPHDLLLRFNEIASQCDVLSNRPFHVPLDVAIGDLPKETRHRLQLIQRATELTDLLRVKDDVIAAQEKDVEAALSVIQASANKLRNVDLAASQEIREWMRLNQKLHAEVAQLQMVCIFCETVIGPATVNTQCARNSTSLSSPHPASALHTGVPESYLGNGRHFFRQDDG